jgi:hypothetical protein
VGEARQGVAHLAELASGVDLIRVQVADHLDTSRRARACGAPGGTNTQTQKQTTSSATLARVGSSRHAAAARLGLVRAAWGGCCFVASLRTRTVAPTTRNVIPIVCDYPYRCSDYPLPLDRVDRASQNDDLLLEAAVSRRGN